MGKGNCMSAGPPTRLCSDGVGRLSNDDRGSKGWGGTLSWAQAAKVSLMAAETMCVAPG